MAEPLPHAPLSGPVSESPLDTLVVGAGIAGLSYAQARGPDARLLLLEASDRPGGVIVTGRAAEMHYECGPEALQDNAPETLALLDELGLRVAPASSLASRRWVLLSPTRLVTVPSGPGSLLSSALLSPWAKLRLLRGLLLKRSGDLEGSLADFVRSRFGSELLQRLVDPAISGIYAGDPELLSLEGVAPSLQAMLREHGSILSGLRARSRQRRAAAAEGGERGRKGAEQRPGPPSLLSVAGGLESIPRAIAAGLGDRLRLGCRVQAVFPRENGWAVISSTAETILCRRLVLALPAARAAALLSSALPEVARELKAQQSESVVNLVHLWRRQDIAHALDGFGYLVPSQLGLSHLGTLFSSSIQPARCPPGQVLLRTLLGGPRHPELLELDDAELLQIMIREVGPVLGLASAARPLFFRAVRWPAVLPRYDLDHPARQARIEGMLEQYPGLQIIGNHRRGISVNALIASSRALARSHGEAAALRA